MAKAENEKTEKTESRSEGTWSSSGEFPGRVEASFRSVADAACDVVKQVEEGMMSLVPPEVTSHLVQAQKEFILASRRVGDKAMEELEKKAERAREIHERMKAEKEGSSTQAGKGKKSASGGKA